MNNILNLTLGVLFGAITSYMVPLAVSYFLSKKSKQKILGTWLATWQPKIECHEEWVIEEVNIQKDFFRGLKFESLKNAKGFNWIGFGKVFEKRHITGEWHSLNSAAYANGAFLFTIAARGDFMCGYDTAPDENGKIRYREFFLGRNENDLEKAKKWMQNEAFSIPSHSTFLKANPMNNKSQD